MTTAYDAPHQSRALTPGREPPQAGNAAGPVDFEAEFERFAAALVSASGEVTGPRERSTARCPKPRDAKPSVSTELIHERALLLLDAEGPRALTVRRLAAELKISTRTLYKRIGTRDNMVRSIVELHFSKLELEFQTGPRWEATAWNWCSTLHRALCAHPHLTTLMSDADAAALDEFVTDLVSVIVEGGVPQHVAMGCCRALTRVTVNDAMRNARTSSRAVRNRAHLSSHAEFGLEFENTVRLILAGVRGVTEQRDAARE